MARIRSPNYPAFSLPEAIDKIKIIYEKEQHLAAPKNVIAKHLGYSSSSGSSQKTVSAIGKYGLIEDAGNDKFRVSSLAVSILHPSTPEEKALAIREAAFKPDLFEEISTEWDGHIPSDENLKSYLLKRNFAMDAISKVIQSYRETVDLVAEYPVKNEYIAQKEPTSSAHIPQEIPQDTPMTISIIGEKIQVSATLKDLASVEKLINALNATKGLLPN